MAIAWTKARHAKFQATLARKRAAATPEAPEAKAEPEMSPVIAKYAELGARIRVEEIERELSEINRFLKG